jgi:hypothetical protein
MPQCTVVGADALPCGCNVYVNPANAAALAQLKGFAADYEQNACGAGVACAPCAPTLGASCSPAGSCEETPRPGGRGCKVAGVDYPDGATGIPDPVSCNQCSCQDGSLACTKIACPMPCPAGSTFGQQCAACGPTDACQVVEFGCFPSCVDGCAAAGSRCLSGICVSSFCG